MSQPKEESLCKTCKHGLCVIAIDPANTDPREDEIDSWQFCNVMGTPIKFTSAKFTVECSKYAKGK
jgi:hypothetical protein